LSYAADFKTNTRGRHLGVKPNRRTPGAGELEVFDRAVAMEERFIFSKDVHDQLSQHAPELQRLRPPPC
jgi:hypothetical protein